MPPVVLRGVFTAPCRPPLEPIAIFQSFSAPNTTSQCGKPTGENAKTVIVCDLMKSRRAAAPKLTSLENGQIWKLDGKCLEVKHVGKFLVEFILTNRQMEEQGHKRIRTPKQIESIRTVLEFLNTHNAVLVPSATPVS